jgi:hypothetical protein
VEWRDCVDVSIQPVLICAVARVDVPIQLDEFSFRFVLFFLWPPRVVILYFVYYINTTRTT